MKKIRFIFAALLFFLQLPAAEKFFSKGTGAESPTLPADLLYPQGQLFPFGFYSTGGGSDAKRGELLPQAQRDADQKVIFDAGATVFGPQYELNFQGIETAKKYRRFFIYTIGAEINGEQVDQLYLRKLARKRQEADWDAVAADIAAKVKAVGNNREIAAWNIVPEELRHWYRNEIKLLQVISETIRKHDPYKRPVFMYEPGHRGADDMSKTFKYMDMGAKGTYTNYSGYRDKRVWVRHSISETARAMKMCGREKEMVLCMLPEMFRQPKPEELPLIRSWVRHDVYCALANGAKAVFIFSASRRPKFTAWEKYRSEYLAVCRELNGELALGHIILFGREEKDLTLTITGGEKTLSLFDRNLNKQVTYPSVSFRNLAYGKARWLLVVNSSAKPVQAEISQLPCDSRVTVKNLLDDSPAFSVTSGSFKVDLRGYEAAVYKVFCKNTASGHLLQDDHADPVAANLKRFADAFNEYAFNNGGSYPEGIGVKGLNLLIRDEYLNDPKVYRNPLLPIRTPLARRLTTYSRISENECDFYYPGDPSQKSGVQVLLMTKPFPGKPRYVLYTDGTIKKFPPSEQ